MVKVLGTQLCDEQETQIGLIETGVAINRETDCESCDKDHLNAVGVNSKNDNDNGQQNIGVGEGMLMSTDQKADTASSDSKCTSLPTFADPELEHNFVGNDHSEVEDSNNSPLHITDTWEEITKRDRSLSDENLVHVIDHSMAMLGERICEATNEKHFRDSLKTFEHTLARFRNSDIELGKRVASGSFADIYLIRSFRQDEKDQIESLKKSTIPDKVKVAKFVNQNKPHDYVVKVLRKNLLVSTSLFATGAADLITEGTLLASFKHPHILSIRGRSLNGVEGFSGGRRGFWLIFEKMDMDLTQKIQLYKKKISEYGFFGKGRRNFNLSLLRERIVLLSNLASALTYLHERNVIHRDVALSNVGISSGEGNVKLLDFGLAKVLPSTSNVDERFLLTGTTGSIRYMAPEIGLKQPYNLKADVYSFAILLYEVLSLEKVFGNLQSKEIFERVHKKKHRPRISIFWSQRIKELLRCCWSDNPDDRLPMNYVEAVLEKESIELQMAEESL